MHKLEDLLQKFWDNTINQEELLILQTLLERFHHKINSEIKDDFPDSFKNQDLIESKKSLEILQALHNKIVSVQNDTSLVIRIVDSRLWWAAAACLIISFCSFFLFNESSTKLVQLTDTAGEAQKSVQKKISNESVKLMEVSLQDGSQVKLYPNSSIIYEAVSLDNQRKITLSGKALFKVAKDKHRPFTVVADNISTTALGTEFLVNMRARNNVSVKLFEGKVVIRSTDKTKLLMGDKYLLPGQELTYEPITKKYVVVAFKEKTNIGKTFKKPTPSEELVNKSMEFNNEPLEKVFKKVAMFYNVKILYGQTDINGLFFTGTFSRSDNLDGILSIICDINGLEYDLQDDLVKIKKFE